MGKIKHAMSKAGMALKQMYMKGKRSIVLYYTREVGGKQVPNYKRIALTAAIVAAAGTGAYLLYRHKKHGHVIKKA